MMWKRSSTCTACEARCATTFRQGFHMSEHAAREVRANLRRLVKRVLRRHGYPPDKQETARRTVLEQAEVLSEGWAAQTA